MASRRKRYFVVVATFLVLGVGHLITPPAEGETLDITVAITPAPGGPRFAPDLILIPSSLAVARLSLLNPDVNPHTFTIDALPFGTAVNISLAPGDSAIVNLTFLDSETLLVEGMAFEVENNGGVVYYSRTSPGTSGRLRLVSDTGRGIPVVYLQVNATSKTVNGEEHPRFEPETILVGVANTVINLTVVNNDPNPLTRGLHTFSIDPADGGNAFLRLDLLPGAVQQVEFTVLESGKLEYRGQVFETAVEGGGTKYYCLPHQGDLMVGRILIGSAAAPQVEGREQGVFLRAYWIGVIGFLSTILLTVVSYWIIKGQSRHHRDHSEHVRKGLP